MIHAVMMWSVLAVLVGLAERLVPEGGHRASITPRALHTDVGWGVLYFVYVPALGAGLAEATDVIGRSTPLHEFVGRTPWGVQLGIVFVVAEVAAYALHRLQHTTPALWRIHSVHHSSAALRWWSALRSHPLDTAMSHGVPVLAAAASGVAPSALVAYLAVVIVVTVLAHADVHIPRTWICAVVVTPRFHRSHHEFGREGTNFARVLPLCDLAFRTASNEVGDRSFGTASEVPRNGLGAQLAWGFHADRRSNPSVSVSE